jgi:hypothetical protein
MSPLCQAGEKNFNDPPGDHFAIHCHSLACPGREARPERLEMSTEAQARFGVARARVAVNDLRFDGCSWVLVALELASRGDDADPTGLPRAWLSPNHDLDVLVERRQEVH